MGATVSRTEREDSLARLLDDLDRELGPPPGCPPVLSTVMSPQWALIYANCAEMSPR